MKDINFRNIILSSYINCHKKEYLDKYYFRELKKVEKEEFIDSELFMDESDKFLNFLEDKIEETWRDCPQKPYEEKYLILEHVYRHIIPPPFTGRLYYSEVALMRGALKKAYEKLAKEKFNNRPSKENPYPFIFAGKDNTAFNCFEKLKNAFITEKKETENNQDINFIYTYLKKDGLIVITAGPSDFKNWLQDIYPGDFMCLTRIKNNRGETNKKKSLYNSIVSDDIKEKFKNLPKKVK